MEIIGANGNYIAISVVHDDACVRWHGFNFKPWHVGVFARTRHGLTLIGVVSADAGGEFTWWANYRGEFYAENYSIDSYSAPDDYDVLNYQGSYRDFLTCVDAAVEFLAAQSDA